MFHIDMKKLFHVYIIKNKINNKVYVGKTSGDYNKRWKKHIKIAEGKGSYASYTKYAIHLAINKYGKDSFTFSVLNSFNSEDEAYLAEIDYIKEYDSVKNGYNISLGGKSGSSSEDANAAIFSATQIMDIFNDFTKEISGAEIAKKFNCSKTTIYDIINRITYCSVVIDEEVLKKVDIIKEKQKKINPNKINKNNVVKDYLGGLSYRDIAKKYKSSTFTISKILKSQISQDIINNNKVKPIDKVFAEEIIKMYIISNSSAEDLGKKYKVSKYVIYDILRGKTFDIEDLFLKIVKEVKKIKSAKKINSVYDFELEEFLLQKNINYKNINQFSLPFLKDYFVESKHMFNHNMAKAVFILNTKYNRKGCIFTLPSDDKDSIFVCYISMNPDVFKRYINLKSFM